MTVITREIDEIVRQAKESRVKTAETADEGFPSGGETSTIPSEIGLRLKEASNKIRTNGTSVDTRSVLQFMKRLS